MRTSSGSTEIMGTWSCTARGLAAVRPQGEREEGPAQGPNTAQEGLDPPVPERAEPARPPGRAASARPWAEDAGAGQDVPEARAEEPEEYKRRRAIEEPTRARTRRDEPRHISAVVSGLHQRPRARTATQAQARGGKGGQQGRGQNIQRLYVYERRRR